MENGNAVYAVMSTKGRCRRILNVRYADSRRINLSGQKKRRILMREQKPKKSDGGICGGVAGEE